MWEILKLFNQPQDIHIHLHAVNEEKLDKIIANQEKIMAKVDELEAELVEANNATNELAADVDDLKKLVESGSAAGGLSAAEADRVKEQLNSLKNKLQSVAATHTPSSQSNQSSQAVPGS